MLSCWPVSRLNCKDEEDGICCWRGDIIATKELHRPMDWELSVRKGRSQIQHVQQQHSLVEAIAFWMNVDR